MKALVTGAGGFVGRSLLERLAARGHGGWATGREPPSDPPAGWRVARRADVLADTCDADGIDAVVHLEVKHHVPRPTPADIRDFHETNVIGTRQWLAWAARHRVRRFVLVSSIKATAPGSEAERVADAANLDAANPEEIYGRSKAAAESAVRDWTADEACRIGVVLRPAPVYGPGNGANLAAFVRQVIAGWPCLVGSGDTPKSVVSRSNLVAAIEFAMAWAVPGCEVFNVSDSETFSLREFAGMISTLADAPRPRGIPTWLATVIARIGDAFTAATGGEFPLSTGRMDQMLASSVFPSTKLVAAGFRHPQTTREGLAELIDWIETTRGRTRSRRVRSAPGGHR